MNEVESLPKPPKFSKIIGPSFILLGLALGSGELILWPFLSANYGLGLLWGALLGISLQYFLNTESMRYTLYQGESVFVGFSKLSLIWPIWFILSTFIPWSLPGFSSVAGEIVNNSFPNINISFITIIFLILAGLLLSLGKKVYSNLKLFEKIIVFSSVPFIFFLVLLTTNLSDWWLAIKGLVGIGNGWWFFPKGVALGSFLGAFAYAGAGGNINLTQSYYIKEEGFGMGKYGSKISTLFSQSKNNSQLEGKTFFKNPENESLWQRWWKLVCLEHGLVFWFSGLITIIMLSVLSFNLTYGQANKGGMQFLFLQAHNLSQKEILPNTTWPILGSIFLILVTLALFSTQVIILEASSRIISENIALFTKKKNDDLSKLFFIVLWSQISFGIILALFYSQIINTYLAKFLTIFNMQPKNLLNYAANLNAIAMMISFPLVLFLNKKKLEKKYQPNFLRQIIMILGFFFFAFFSYITFFGN